jgi:hypothetical protein
MQGGSGHGLPQNENSHQKEKSNPVRQLAISELEWTGKLSFQGLTCVLHCMSHQQKDGLM